MLFDVISLAGWQILVASLLVLFAGAVLLQIFLSTRKNPLVGLFLPVLSFVGSILLSIVLFFLGYIWGLLIGFILGNIPTVILFVIYGICRIIQRVTKPKQPDLHNEPLNE